MGPRSENCGGRATKLSSAFALSLLFHRSFSPLFLPSSFSLSFFCLRFLPSSFAFFFSFFPFVFSLSSLSGSELPNPLPRRGGGVKPKYTGRGTVRPNPPAGQAEGKATKLFLFFPFFFLSSLFLRSATRRLRGTKQFGSRPLFFLLVLYCKLVGFHRVAGWRKKRTLQAFLIARLGSLEPCLEPLRSAG